ncbi:MAG: GNAT family N-acetyltransferase [Betaproteobacteria bacterium]|nr:GNAT family N-acetyltransferase [Betaproteobacteria bacterium]
MAIVDITDASGRIAAPDVLARAERVHRQLRSELPADYPGTMARVFAGGGRMCVAVAGDEVLGVAVHRTGENTADGVHMYVDDLVTDEARRSRGIGRALMAHLQAIARAAGCEALILDSGTQRQQAHKFYFREGMVITSFNFKKGLPK